MRSSAFSVLIVGVLLNVGLAPSARAEGTEPVAVSSPNQPNLDALRNICTAVAERSRVEINPVTKATRLEFFVMMDKAAGVSEVGNTKNIDIESERKLKWRDLWDKHQDRFYCSIPGFDLVDGSILMLAVRKRSLDIFSYFIEYELNFNYLHPDNYGVKKVVYQPEGRGQTVMDYLKREILSNNGNETAEALTEYYISLRDAGALHCVELKDNSLCKPFASGYSRSSEATIPGLP
jgi:hypothetical protein